MAEAIVAKFCMQVEYIKCWPWGVRLPPTNGCDQGHVTRFTARRYASAVCCRRVSVSVYLSVCTPVCLSETGTVPKRLKVG